MALFSKTTLRTGLSQNDFAFKLEPIMQLLRFAELQKEGTESGLTRDDNIVHQFCISKELKLSWNYL